MTLLGRHLPFRFRTLTPWRTFVTSCSAFTADATVYDVIVVGGGHAGVEACCAASRMGARTLLITQKKETVGEMSCNPSFGGIGKGHLVKEVDALGGVCGRVCDKTGIHYKMLNKTKGPAVWGPRAQIDRKLYKLEIQNEVFNSTPNLEVMFTSVDDLIIDSSSNTCKGVLTGSSTKIYSKTVILTTGTFLNGQINIGLKVYPAGRIGDEPSIPLALTLKQLNFRMGRLKTGTPPRLRKETISFEVCEKEMPDCCPSPFSFMNDKVWINPEDQLLTYKTITNDKVGEIILNNMHLNRHVQEEVTGPRYCPSIESKYLRFKNRNHVIWLEPEGLDSDIIYPGGLSCTLPEELQIHLIHQIRGLENAEIVRPGYGVEYDFVDPTELKPTLETIKMPDLFFAGQINGTTGYEEAAAQGLIAGINAAAKCQNKSEFILSRSEAYIGVLIDDLTSRGTNEPYRMFTTRAEFRLYLRPDNADLRLSPKGYEIGCVSEERLMHTKKAEEGVKEIISCLKAVKKSPEQWSKIFEESVNVKGLSNISAYEALNVMNKKGKLEKIGKLLAEMFDGSLKNSKLCERAVVEITYASPLLAEMAEIEEIRREEALKIPSSVDYGTKSLGLNNEEIEKLEMIRPQTMAAASRIPGVRPTSLIRLMKLIQKNRIVNHSEALQQVLVYCAADEKLKRVLPYHSESKAEVWRFLTYMLLHTNVLHLTLNVVIQGLLGTPLELEQGWLRCSGVYLGGGLAGSLGASAFASFSSMVGGSGGVYALLSSHIPNIVLNYETTKYAAYRTVAIAALAASDVIYLLCHVYFFNNERPRIGWVAHASGAVAGLLLGFLFFRGTSKWKKKFRMTSCLILALPSMSAIAFSLATYTLRLLNS